MIAAAGWTVPVALAIGIGFVLLWVLPLMELADEDRHPFPMPDDEPRPAEQATPDRDRTRSAGGGAHLIGNQVIEWYERYLVDERGEPLRLTEEQRRWIRRSTDRIGRGMR